MDVKEHYLKNQVNSASQEQLLVMLLEGGEKFIRLAMKALENDDVEGVHNNITKAQNIYLELFCSLDPEAGDFVQNLHGLYYFMYNNLVEANVKKDISIMDNCLKVAGNLTMMWKETIDKAHEERIHLNDDSSDNNNVKSIDFRG